MNTTTLRRLTAIGVTTAVLAACGGSADTGGAGQGSTDALFGQWVLSDGTGPDGPIPLVPGADITLGIDVDRWGGVAACNSYGGEVTVAGDRVTVGGVAVTEMACMGDGIMASEAAYLAAFQLVTGFVVGDDADTLVLTGDEVELRFDRVPPVDDAALVGTRWVLDGLISGSGPDGAVSSVWNEGEGELLLQEDGSLAGSTGCNRIMGGYTVDGTTLRLTGPLATTRMACEDGLSQQEAHVLAVLDGEVEVAIDGARLTLTHADGLGLTYRADG